MPLNGSDFVSSKSPVSVKSRICSRNRSDASILKLWKNVYDKDNERAHEKAPQRLKEENQNEKQAHDERRHGRSDGWFSGSLRRFHYRQHPCFHRISTAWRLRTSTWVIPAHWRGFWWSSSALLPLSCSKPRTHGSITKLNKEVLPWLANRKTKNGFRCVPCFFLPVGFYHDLPAAVAGGELIQIQ